MTRFSPRLCRKKPKDCTVSLTVMGPWTQAGFTIDRLDFSLDFLFDAISRFGLQRQLRLGLAHPVPGSQAGFIQAEDMRRVVERLYYHRPLFETDRVRPDLDCGFPLCQFSDAELGWLHRLRGHAPGGCGPALDISPDLSVSHCFPLVPYQSKSLFEFDSLEQLDRTFCAAGATRSRRKSPVSTQNAMTAVPGRTEAAAAGGCAGSSVASWTRRPYELRGSRMGFPTIVCPDSENLLQSFTGRSVALRLNSGRRIAAAVEHVRKSGNTPFLRHRGIGPSSGRYRIR